MIEPKAIEELWEQLSGARALAEEYVAQQQRAMDVLDRLGTPHPPGVDSGRVRELSRLFHRPLVRLVTLLRESSVLGDGDARAAQLALKRIDAALRFRQYREWGPEVMHDEGVVLAVNPAGSGEFDFGAPRDALSAIDSALEDVIRRLEILRAEAEAGAAGGGTGRPSAFVAGELAVRANTAFVMMMIAPETRDASQAIKEEFARFGIQAVRADDIEHADEITHRILEEIRTSEFLLADLTGERPSVYYELGYAHAVGKRPILYRRAGTPLHFDLKVHNCPEYADLTDLRSKLNKRLAAMTGRS